MRLKTGDIVVRHSDRLWQTTELQWVVCEVRGQYAELKSLDPQIRAKKPDETVLVHVDDLIRFNLAVPAVTT